MQRQRTRRPPGPPFSPAPVPALEVPRGTVVARSGPLEVVCSDGAAPVAGAVTPPRTAAGARQQLPHRCPEIVGSEMVSSPGRRQPCHPSPAVPADPFPRARLRFRTIGRHTRRSPRLRRAAMAVRLPRGGPAQREPLVEGRSADATVHTGRSGTGAKPVGGPRWPGRRCSPRRPRVDDRAHGAGQVQAPRAPTPARRGWSEP
jgi:hypothetical protein